MSVPDPAPPSASNRAAKPSLGTSAAPEVDSRSRTTIEPETEPIVLDEIDRIIDELHSRKGIETTFGDQPPQEEPGALGLEESLRRLTESPDDATRGSMEAALTAARQVIETIDAQVDQLESTSADLRQRVTDAEAELNQISRECGLGRQRDWTSGSELETHSSPPPWQETDPGYSPSSLSPSTSGSWRSPREFAPESPAASASPSYARFTVARYNRTIDALKGRRNKLVVLTLLLSAAIGAFLTLVVLYSPVTNPPLWVAVLPLVWIVPIPFFLLSFRGAHRVVQQNPLHLPEVR